MKAKLL